jgi:hypothetical protein
MPWTRVPWEELPSRLIRDGPNGALFQAWDESRGRKAKSEDIVMADLAVAARSRLPHRCHWRRRGGKVYHKR